MYMQILFDTCSIFNWMEKIVVHNPKEIRYNTIRRNHCEENQSGNEICICIIYMITRKNIVLNITYEDHQKLITR